MRPPPRGLTLIEQLVALAVVGTVSATALPALVDLHAQADATTLAGLAAAAGSAMLLNQAGCMVTQQQAVPGKCQPMRDCSDVGVLLIGAVPEGYQVPAQPLQPGEGQCLLMRLHDGATAAFYAVGTGR